MNNIAAQLAQLETSQLVRRLMDEDLQYIFKHTLTQETAYASLLKKTRRDIHRMVAQAIEATYADRLDEFAALLETHYAEAEDDAKTIEYAIRAGDASARVNANAEAVAHYSIAIDAAKRVGTIPELTVRDLWLKRGRALELIGKYADALASYGDMESFACARNEPALELASLVARATLFSTHTPLHDGKRGQEYSAQALVYARKIGDRLAEARILWTQMLFHIFSSGDGPASVTAGEQSLQILRELSAQPGLAHDRAVREQLAYTLNDLLYACSQVAQLERGLTTRLEARDLWRELDNKAMLADNLAGVSIAQWCFGDAPAAIVSADECFAIAESVSNPWSMAQGRTMRGYALAELGRFHESFDAFSAGDGFATAAETGGAMIASRCGAAFNFITLGILDQGFAHAERALDASNQHLPDWHLWPQAVLIRAFLARGDLASAERIAEESGIRSPERKLFRAFMPGVAAVVLADAELALALKNYARVIDIADEAFEYLHGSAPCYLPDLYLLRAGALLGLGEQDQAARVMQDALVATSKARRVRWKVLGAASVLERARGNVSAANRLRDAARAEIQFIAANLNDGIRESFRALAMVRQILGGAQ